jgi:hypothetical protein
MWHYSFICDITHLYVWRDKSIRVTLLICTCQSTHSYLYHGACNEVLFTRHYIVLQCVAMCCSVLQCAAAHICHVTHWCDVQHLFQDLILQCVAVRCSVLQCVAMCCSVLQCVAVCCRVLQHIHVMWIVQVTWSTFSKTLHSSVLQCVAVCCSVLQCVVMCCRI